MSVWPPASNDSPLFSPHHSRAAGSQTARVHGEKQYGRVASTTSLPPPPLPRAALQLPRAHGAATSPRNSVTLHRSGPEHRITKWIASILPSTQGQPVSKQVEQLFWPSRQPLLPSVTPRSGQPLASPSQAKIAPAYHAAAMTISDHTSLEESSAIHALGAAHETIAAQQLEIEILKRQTQTQMSVDLTYEELQNENRNLRQLKYVIQELERKVEEMKAMKSERKQQYASEMDKMLKENQELAQKYESVLQDFLKLQQANTKFEKDLAKERDDCSLWKSRYDDERMKFTQQTLVLGNMQSQQAKMSNEIILVTSQLDTSRSNLQYVKSELETSQQELFSLQRVREIQAEVVESLQNQKSELESKVKELEQQVAQGQEVPILRAQLVEAQKERTLLQDSLTLLQKKNDTLESLLEEYQVREKNAWKQGAGDGEDDDLVDGEVDMDKLVQEYRAMEAKKKEEEEKRQDENGTEWEEYEEEEEIVSIVQTPKITPAAPSSMPSSIDPDLEDLHSSSSPSTGAQQEEEKHSGTAGKLVSSSPSSAPKSSPSEASTITKTVTKVKVIKKRPKATAGNAATPNKPVSIAGSPTLQPFSSTSSSHARRPSNASSGLALPVGTTLSRKLEKCLNETLRDNTRLSGQLYTMQLQCKSLQTREEQNKTEMATFSNRFNELSKAHSQLEKTKARLEKELKNTERRREELEEEYHEEKLISEKRNMTLRTVRGELEKLKQGSSASEQAAREWELKMKQDLMQLRQQLVLETKMRQDSEKQMEKAQSDLNALLSQHGLALKAKEAVLSNFSKTVAQNAELNMRLQIAEAMASKTRTLEDRLTTVEHTLAQTESSLKKTSAENTALQTSLQGLSEAHTEQTGALQRLLLKSQQQGLENSKLQTKVQNLLAQLNSEDHSKSSDSARVKAMQAEHTAMSEKLATLETQLADEKKQHQSRLENYRSARKESQTNKTKLFNLKSVEVKLRASLEKEMSKVKKLEMEVARLSVRGSAASHAPIAAAAVAPSATSATLIPSSNSQTSLSGGSTTSLHASASVAEMRLLAGVGGSEDEFDGAALASSLTPQEDDALATIVSVSPHTTEPSTRVHSPTPTPLGVLVDFHLLAPSTGGKTEDPASGEERKREQERAAKRRMPKRTQQQHAGEKDQKEDEHAPAPPAPKGFYAEMAPKAKKKPAALTTAGLSNATPPATARATRESPTVKARGSPLLSSVSASSTAPNTPRTDDFHEAQQVAAPFLDPFVPPPKSLAAATEKLAAQQQALQSLIDLHSSATHAFEARLAAAIEASEQRGDKLDQLLREAQERADLIAERSKVALKAEREKYDQLLASNLKNETQLKQLKQQVAMLRAKVG